MSEREPYRRRPEAPDEMDLPAGKTCGDCRHMKRCAGIFGRIPADEVCDWAPSRFQQRPETLAVGAALDEGTWADFVARLRYHCVGAGVEDHCTAEAIFIVQKRTVVSGIDRDYTDKLMVYCEESSWISPKEYWSDLGTQERWDLRRRAIEAHGRPFLLLDEGDQWDVLADLDDHTVTGWEERWDYVSAHFTREAADAFIRRKAHDYDSLRVYVECQNYAWEFNAIKQAILDGRLILAPATKEAP